MIYPLRYLKIAASILLLVCFSAPLHAQQLKIEATSGLPFIQNYQPDQYQADAQNWAIVQDQGGIMYFGNSDGVLEYDGVSWRVIKTEAGTVVRSLAVDQNNRIFVGAYGEIGYLAPDAAGQLQYTSLLSYVDEEQLDFTDVWQTIVTDEGVYFSTQKYIFRWANEEMKVWQPETVFLLTASVNQKIYVRQWKTGLHQIVGDSLQAAPNGEAFIKNRTSVILPYTGEGGTDMMLVCSQTTGLFLWDGHSLQAFPTAFDEILAEARIYQAIRLANGNYAIATIKEGLIIMDKQGNLLQHLNKATGLQNNTVWSLHEDRQAGLWVGMNIGISRAEISTPLSYFSDREGVEGAVFSMARHQGVLYIATSSGIYYLDESPQENGQRARQFKPVTNISPQGWALLSVGNTLLAGTFQGVYEIKGDKGDFVTRGYTFSLSRSKLDTNRVFIGLQAGLNSLYYSAGQWKDEGRVKGTNQEIRDVVETPSGKLWLTTRYQGLLQVDFSAGLSLDPKVVRFDTLQGLPAGDRNVAFLAGDEFRFATPKGIYRFDDDQQRFVPDTALIKGYPNQGYPIFSIIEGHRKNTWILSPKGVNSGIAVLQTDGSYTWDASPLNRLNDGDLNMSYADPMYQDITWFGGNERLIQFNAATPKNYTLDYKTLIRQVVANNDSLLYGGRKTEDDENSECVQSMSYAYNSLQFKYAASSFDGESKSEYQYFLEGFDKDWSKWSNESQKEYTNLPEGDYRFQVRAKNAYQHLGSTASYEFEILPPFYRTWWAYLIYLALILSVLYGIWQYEVKRINARHFKELKLLEYDKLKELDELKSRFFANISHEFRTPLTLILGPLENLISRSAKKEDTQELSLMKRSAQSLLRLINQLLDLSRLEAGKMQLEAHNEDIIPFLKGLFYAFESLAMSKNIDQHFETDIAMAIVHFDFDKMGQILKNILSNAFKFTPEGGKVSLQVKSLTDKHSAPLLSIEIIDTGIGISGDQLPYVFDRFYQAVTADSQNEQGSGIGLALAKELVELHQGQISVESKLGEGTHFTISLPMKDNSAQSHPIGQSVNQTEPDLFLEAIPAAVSPEVALVTKDNSTEQPIALLVEDNTDMRTFIQRQLATTYQVIAAADGQEGIEKAIEFIPDLIISDVMMPRMDGLQLCDFLKKDERTSHIPIILLTAKADILSRLEGLERGADAYLAKPFNREELLLRSRKQLELRQVLRERYASLQPPAPVADKDVQIEDAFLEKVRLIVTQHLQETGFDIEQLSNLTGMSRSQLFRKIKALTGESPSLFIRAVRLSRAKELLETTQMNISEVAYQVGFSSPAYFSETFFKAFGTRPSKLRQ